MLASIHASESLTSRDLTRLKPGLERDRKKEQHRRCQYQRQRRSKRLIELRELILNQVADHHGLRAAQEVGRYERAERRNEYQHDPGNQTGT